MALPKQVRDQSAAIKSLYDELNTDPSTAAAAAEKPVVEVVENNADRGTDPANPAAVEVQPAAGTEFEQKYKTLQGMYNAEVPRLHEDLKSNQQRVRDLEALVASFTAVNPTSAAPAAPVQVTEADRVEYGDSIEMMRKVTQEQLHPFHTRLTAMETALNNLATNMNTSVIPQVRQVAQQQALSAEDRFWNDLSRDVPNWMQINNDPAFKAWLLEVDPLTGTARQSFLKQAQDRLDISRVVAFFRTFAGAGTAAAATGETQLQPARSASELERQIAPSKARGGKPPANNEAKTYTHPEIAQFYADVLKGVYRGREAERNKTEADIIAATREGRITNNP